VTLANQENAETAEIPISEAGYLPIPHKNKFGRDYTPAPDDGGIYPAARK
jgi:hypothetical protein